ncbi:tRNA dihydrouridine synthase DusB [Hellea sp.]|nr:tRNA dihydrouridine synthase DusB [Hellea sp.]
MPKIGKYELQSRVLVAPMSGLTDLPFRRVVNLFNPGLIVSEMVAGRMLAMGKPDTLAKASGKGEIDPLVIQLVGCEKSWMSKAARLSEEAGASFIDINMGCPARKVTSGMSGSALMRDIDNAIQLIVATINSVDVPVTLKMRLGWDNDSLNAPLLAVKAQEAGIKMIVVHGRTRCQFYDGKADWSAVKETVDAVDIPVFVNGDINTAHDAIEALDKSCAAGVMVGRSLIGSPWRLQEIISAVDGSVIPMKLKISDKKKIVLDHYNDIINFYGEKKGVKIARKHLIGYIDDLNLINGSEIKSSIVQMSQSSAVYNILNTTFSKAGEDS